jgi:alanine racemase
MSPLTWAEIDLSAIRNNVQHMQALTRTGVMAVVKANAYGHGAVEVSRAAVAAGAQWLGVARAAEGMALRAAGLAAPILALGHTLPDEAPRALAHAISLAVYDADSARAYAAARALGAPARLHLKVDTGMGRLGCRPAEVLDLMRFLQGLDGIVVEGLFTHFASSDLADQRPTLAQLAEFNTVLAALNAAGLRPPLIHASNSAGAIAYPAARFDLVRMGIALYGLNPSEAVPCPPAFRPALAWKSRVVQVKTLPPGHGVSYGAEYVTQTTETLAVVAVGYADGFRRAPKNVNEVLINGTRAPVRGRVCMDQIVVGVDPIPTVRVGDEVILVGPGLTADEVARRWGTINYDVTTGIMARVPRVFQGAEGT